MTLNLTTTLPLAEDNVMGPATSTATFTVTGMTCGHCVSAVTAELSALAGVSAVDIDLISGGTSTVTVTSDSPISRDQAAAALDEAGDYHLADG